MGKAQRNYEEDNLLMACVSWCDLYFLTHYRHLMVEQVDRKGHVRLVAPLVHVANERATSPQAGARLKKKGVRSGIPDLELKIPCGKYASLYIELKSATGRMNQNQKNWREFLEMHSRYEVHRTLEGFQKSVIEYMDDAVKRER